MRKQTMCRTLIILFTLFTLQLPYQAVEAQENAQIKIDELIQEISLSSNPDAIESDLKKIDELWNNGSRIGRTPVSKLFAMVETKIEDVYEVGRPSTLFNYKPTLNRLKLKAISNGLTVCTKVFEYFDKNFYNFKTSTIELKVAFLLRMLERTADRYEEPTSRDLIDEMERKLLLILTRLSPNDSADFLWKRRYSRTAGIVSAMGSLDPDSPRRLEFVTFLKGLVRDMSLTPSERIMARRSLQRLDKTAGVVASFESIVFDFPHYSFTWIPRELQDFLVWNDSLRNVLHRDELIRLLGENDEWRFWAMQRLLEIAESGLREEDRIDVIETDSGPLPEWKVRINSVLYLADLCVPLELYIEAIGNMNPEGLPGGAVSRFCRENVMTAFESLLSGEESDPYVRKALSVSLQKLQALNKNSEGILTNGFDQTEKDYKSFLSDGFESAGLKRLMLPGTIERLIGPITPGTSLTPLWRVSLDGDGPLLMDVSRLPEPTMAK